MKNFIKRFTAVISAVLIFCFSVFPSSVSALSSDGLIYSSADSFTFDFMKSCYDDLLINPSLSDVDFSSSAVYIHFFGPSKVRVIIFPSYTTLKQSTSDGTFTYYFPYDSSFRFIPHYAIETSISTLSSSTFNLTTLLSNEQYSFFAINDDYTNLLNSGSTLCGFTAYNSTRTAFTGSVPSSYYTYKGSFISYVPHSVSPSEPDPSGKLTLTGVRLGVDKKGFLDWLITEGKDSVINSTGFSFTQTQLSLLVDVFDSYGNSLFPFYSSLVKTFKLTQHSLTGASALLSTLQELYRDYLDYKNSIEIVEITPDDSAKPHWRQDKTDNTLVTDHEDDTSVVSILREILRTLIYLPSSIRSSFSDLATNIVSIMYNWNRLFDYLNNLEFPSVEIPDNSSFLEYLFKPTFSDFDNLEAEVKDKFPILSQIEAVPDPDEVIIESNQIVSYASTSDSSVDPDQPVLPSFESENVYNNDFLFSFEVPEGSSFLNGSATGLKVPFSSFSKLLPAIEAFKGIISVIAIAAFSNWLIKFAPKLMHGYSSGD